MAAKRDGVADGWILFEAWCRRNGGTPIRGSSSADHVCYIGPLPDDTIEPGDEGTVDIALPGSGSASTFEQGRLSLQLREAELRMEREKLNYERTKQLIEGALRKQGV